MTVCACGQPLLLARPGRDRCEACRLGRLHPPLPTHPARPDQRETCTGCGQLTACAGGRCLTCRAEVADGARSDAPYTPPGPLTLADPPEAPQGALWGQESLSPTDPTHRRSA